jgi:hypothetical protein
VHADEEMPATGTSKVAQRNAARRARKAAATAHKEGDLPAASTEPEASKRQDDLADAVDAVAEQLEEARVGGGREVAVEVVDDDTKRKRLRALRKKVRLARDRVDMEMAKGSERAAEVDAKLASISEWCATSPTIPFTGWISHLSNRKHLLEIVNICILEPPWYFWLLRQ